MKTDRLQIIFAHHDEAIPPQFLDYAKPSQAEGKSLSIKQIQKWKSRRMAYFLLHHVFEEYHLDTAYLNEITKSKSGRPSVAHPQIDFNISHSGEWVAIIFSYSPCKKAVGIDIEQVRKVRDYLSLLNYYASETEIDEICRNEALPQLTDLASRFYLSWCLREAVLKSQGVGIVKLAEVQHSLSRQQIRSVHCPKGTLCFYHQLPFYLAYFVEQVKNDFPPLLQWRSGKLHAVHLEPIYYQVN